jgi:hypothetical protein
MTDKKDGEGGDSNNENNGIVVPFKEFLRKAEERDAAGEKGAARPPKTTEEMVRQMGMLVGLVVNAHDALLALYKLQSHFMLEHMDNQTLRAYVLLAKPLEDVYAEKLKLLSNPPL